MCSSQFQLITNWHIDACYWPRSQKASLFSLDRFELFFFSSVTFNLSRDWTPRKLCKQFTNLIVIENIIHFICLFSIEIHIWMSKLIYYWYVNLLEYWCVFFSTDIDKWRNNLSPSGKKTIRFVVYWFCADV